MNKVGPCLAILNMFRRHQFRLNLRLHQPRPLGGLRRPWWPVLPSPASHEWDVRDGDNWPDGGDEGDDDDEVDAVVLVRKPRELIQKTIPLKADRWPNTLFVACSWSTLGLRWRPNGVHVVYGRQPHYLRLRCPPPEPGL